MNIIDKFLNSITMYRLVLYYLIILILAALIFSFLHILSFSPAALIFSTLFILVVCYVTNRIFGFVFQAPLNFDSILISALILTLLISPAANTHGLAFLLWAAVWTVASKFILAYKNKHVFNPVAFSLVLMALLLNESASWWVGTLSMMPLVLLGGILIVRKIRRFDMVFYYFLIAIFTIIGFNLMAGNDVFLTLWKFFVDSPILFLGFVMLTEPQTSPPTKFLQSIYGGLVGFLFAPQIHLGSFYSTPEIALCLGNIFSYLVSFKEKLILNLKEKIQIAPDIYDFVFENNKKFAFVAGQYLEWTLPNNLPDSRGNRRYFTIASSPTEDNLRIGVKFYERPSSFKKALLPLKAGDKITAGQLAGDFTLPKDKNEKLVFMAGGIGVTPFRSIVKFLIDTNERRDIVLFYSNKTASDIVYQDIFSQARNLGLKTVYILSDQNIPGNWAGEKGLVDQTMVEKYVSDYKQRTFYLSGPNAMVQAYERTLRNMGIPSSQIKKDYFPGYA